MVNVLILAADDSSDFSGGGYPVCLTEIGGVTLLETVAQRISEIPNSTLTIALSEHATNKWHLEDLVKNFSMKVAIRRIDAKTAGATCTALLATSDLPPEEQLLILNGNEFLDFDYHEMLTRFAVQNADAGIVYFDSLHPRYSYARVDEAGFVQETAEKRPISRHATAGFYWFRTKQLFFESASKQLIKQAQVDGLYYVCPLMNELILMGSKVRAEKISQTQFFPLKSERQLSKFDSHVGGPIGEL